MRRVRERLLGSALLGELSARRDVRRHHAVPPGGRHRFAVRSVPALPEGHPGFHLPPERGLERYSGAVPGEESKT